jgi:hypothetical protein
MYFDACGYWVKMSTLLARPASEILTVFLREYLF